MTPVKPIDDLQSLECFGIDSVDLGPHWFGETRQRCLAWILEANGLDSSEGFDVVEIGSFVGYSTQWWLRNMNAREIHVVDTFEGDAEHKHLAKTDEHLNKLLEVGLLNQFAFNMRCLELSSKIITWVGKSRAALPFVAQHITPSVVYIDGSHASADVSSDIIQSYSLWPEALICGDDFDRQDVREGIREAIRDTDLTVVVADAIWALVPFLRS